MIPMSKCRGIQIQIELKGHIIRKFRKDRILETVKWKCPERELCGRLGFRRGAPASLALRGPIHGERLNGRRGLKAPLGFAAKRGAIEQSNRGTFGAKRHRGFGGLAPQCMKCYNREKAASAAFS